MSAEDEESSSLPLSVTAVGRGFCSTRLRFFGYSTSEWRRRASKRSIESMRGQVG